MATSGESYQITTLNGIQSIYQEYFNYIPGDKADESTIWKMTGSESMENFTNGKGVSPGSFGMVSFYVKPRDASINLDLSFTK